MEDWRSRRVRDGMMAESFIVEGLLRAVLWGGFVCVGEWWAEGSVYAFGETLVIGCKGQWWRI
jgi:hypothetical protein